MTVKEFWEKWVAIEAERQENSLALSREEFGSPTHRFMSQSQIILEGEARVAYRDWIRANQNSPDTTA